MASRKRAIRPLGATHRKHRSVRPLLEDLEVRLVLTQGPSTGLVSYPLASGGTALMLSMGATGLLANDGTIGSQSAPVADLSPSSSGVILAHAPVASPFLSGGPDQVIGPVGYTPVQLQTAYGVNSISFGTTKGDGAGQTIGIYEEGYNPDFVNTYLNGDPGQGINPAYKTSALAVFDKTFGLPDPPDLSFFDQGGNLLTSSNNSTNNPSFGNYGAGDEIALDIEWAHAMAPGASIDVLSGVPDPANDYDDISKGMATLAGLPGMSVVTASYGYDYEDRDLGSVEQSFEDEYLAPAAADHKYVTFFAASGDSGAAYGLYLSVRLSQRRVRRRDQPVSQRRSILQQRNRLGVRGRQPAVRR